MTDVLHQALERVGARDIRSTPEGYECQCPVCNSRRRSFRAAHVGKNDRLGAFTCHKCGAFGGLTELLIRGGMSRDKAEDIAGKSGASLRKRRYRRKERESLGPEHIAPYRSILSQWLCDRGYEEGWIWHYRVGMDEVTNEVVYPTYTAEGDLVGITRRTAEDGRPNFHLGDFEKSKHLWGLDLAVKSGQDCVYLVEGQTGALGLAPVVDPYPVVASFGSHLSPEQAKLLAAYFTTIIIIYDDDVPGKKGTQDARRLLNRAGADVMVGVIPDDVGDTGELPHSRRPEIQHLSFREWKRHTGWKTYAKRRSSSTTSSANNKITARSRGVTRGAKILPWRR